MTANQLPHSRIPRGIRKGAHYLLIVATVQINVELNQNAALR
jgi:hypothetical protein